MKRMKRTGRERASNWRTSCGRIAGAALALGGLSALTIAPSIATAATTPTTASAISTAQDAKLGTILAAGDTVYTLKASKTACTAECLKAWPPVLLPKGVTKASAGTGVDASKLGTAAAAHGAHQITYSGKRLYWFAKDKAPGQVHGNVKDKWGKWAAVTVATSTTAAPNGAAPTTAAPGTAPPATNAPAAAPPATDAPAAAPQATDAPATAPPAATEPPATSPPEHKPAPTTSPSNGGTGF